MHGKFIPLISVILLSGLVTTAFADLIAYWPLDGDARDAVGSHHGTLAGGATFTEDAERGTVLSVDGSSSRVEVPHDDDMAFSASDSYTIMAWVYVEALTGTWQTIVAKSRDIGTHYGIWITDTGEWMGGGWENRGSSVPTEVWVHVAYVQNGTAGTGTTYVNGMVDWQGGTRDGTGAGDFWIGGAASVTEFLGGMVDDVRVYNHALTPAEVKALVPPKLKAYEPNPPDGTIGATSPLVQWTGGDTALFHDVFFGTSPDLTEADKVAARQPFALYYHAQGLTPGTTYYWRIDEVEADMVTVHTGNVWSFTALPLTAYAPAPADGGEKAAQAPTLAWLSGQGAVEHHMYFGDSLEAVRAGAPETDKGPVAETTFNAGLLRAGTTYYWRVDETDMAGEIQTGEIWSFTTGQPAVGKVVREWWLKNSSVAVAGLTDDPRYPSRPSGSEFVDLFEGPTDWLDNYGSRLYGWLIPPESGDYTFWIATDDGGELWLSTDEDPANAQLIAGVPTWVPARDFDNTGGGLGDADAQKSDPIALMAGAKYYIEALMNEGGGGDSIAVAWQVPGGTREVIPGEFVSTYALAPLSAAAPSPENGAADTIQSPILSWFAGENAVRHHVYFGDDADAVAGADTTSAEYKGQQAGAIYNPGALEWGKTYAWRVDEEETDGTIRKGAVWSFTTAAFLVIEDFESYDDNLELPSMAIFATWIDGWENGTTSTVGYLTSVNGTFGETTIVHGGRQSMPLDANNVNSPFYGETSRTFAPPLDMTTGDMDTLTLYVRGQAGNDPVPLYIGLRSGATRVNVLVPDAAIAQATSWQEVNIPLADFAGVNAAAVNEMFISLGNPDAPTSGGAGLIFIDDIRVTKPEPVG